MPDVMALVEGVKTTSEQARERGRKDAMFHLSRLGGMSEEAARTFYDSLRDLLKDKVKIIVNLDVPDLLAFIATGKLIQTYSERRRQIERALGCEGAKPTIGMLTDKEEGDRRRGKCSLVVGDMTDIVLVNGDAGRLRNPSRIDFEEDPAEVLYDPLHGNECKASAAIMALGPHELIGGPGQALVELLDEEKEYGLCHALIFGGPSPHDVSRIVVPDAKTLCIVREALDRANKLIPVVLSERMVAVRAPGLEREEPDAPYQQEPFLFHFISGDRVAFKPSMSAQAAMGTIIDVADGKVTVQWDSLDRTVFDLTEAFARLMQAPELMQPKLGTVVYSLPGMNKETIANLTALGYDPVNIYSMASIHTSAAKDSVGSLNEFSREMADLGLDGKVVSGFAPSEDKIAFIPRKWFEARLPYGQRLVVDLRSKGPAVYAGAVPNYLIKPEFTTVPME